MTQQYSTETGFYVLKDSDGRVAAKANVPIGKHSVPDWVDLSNSFDVESQDELDGYMIDAFHRD